MLLRTKDKERLFEIFSSIEIPIEVWAYGSRVNGEAHDGSDLDLVIRGKELKRIPSEIFSDLKYKIQESNIPILVDMFDWTLLPESFRANIQLHHEVLFNNLQGLNEPDEKYGNDKENEIS